MEKQHEQINNKEGAPPILGTWKRVYALVFFHLIFLIILFYFFTKKFS